MFVIVASSAKLDIESKECVCLAIVIMEVQVAQVNKATIKDVISIRSNDANSAVVVFKDATTFNTAKRYYHQLK